MLVIRRLHVAELDIVALGVVAVYVIALLFALPSSTSGLLPPVLTSVDLTILSRSSSAVSSGMKGSKRSPPSAWV